MIFLTNPRTKGKRRMRKRRTAAQRRATAKLVRLNKARARGRKSNPRRRRRKATTTRRRKTVATRRRRPVRRRNPVRRKRATARRRSPVRRRRRRNPPRGFTVRGIGRRIQRGAFDAMGVLGGKVGTRVLAQLLPIPGKTGPMMNFLVQAGSAIVVGQVASMFVSADMARMVVAGGLATPVESFLRGIPVIGPMLGDDFLELGDVDPFLPVGEYAPEVGEYNGLTPGAYDDGMGDADPFLPVGEYGVGEYAY